MSKQYKVMRGIEKGDVRYESGEVVPADKLKGWPVKAWLTRGVIVEVKAKVVSNGNR